MQEWSTAVEIAVLKRFYRRVVDEFAKRKGISYDSYRIARLGGLSTSFKLEFFPSGDKYIMKSYSYFMDVLKWIPLNLVAEAFLHDFFKCPHVQLPFKVLAYERWKSEVVFSGKLRRTGVVYAPKVHICFKRKLKGISIEYLAIEDYVEGPTVNEILKRGEESLASKVGELVGESLARLHEEHGIINLDQRPENLKVFRGSLAMVDNEQCLSVKEVRTQPLETYFKALALSTNVYWVPRRAYVKSLLKAYVRSGGEVDVVRYLTSVRNLALYSLKIFIDPDPKRLYDLLMANVEVREAAKSASSW